MFITAITTGKQQLLNAEIKLGRKTMCELQKTNEGNCN